MIHASETWAQTLSEVHRLLRNDRAMIRWMSGITTKGQISALALLKRMQFDDGTPHSPTQMARPCKT